ncbi:hypothetical protein [Corynebacterium nasicanis]|uniref:AraC family transcriptional regulator n=1 Tax=Corynebacterium nasicanis TaxID=1448267 RepID=A0ABW1Q901_9CORY
MSPEISVPAHAFLAPREVIPTSDMHAYFDRAFRRAADVLAELGLHPAGPARAYYYSGLGETVDLAGGFPLAPEQVAAVETAHPELVHHVPASAAMTARHVGSYDTLGQSWQELTESVRRSGRPTGAVFWEEYVTMPTPEADPADMITDLYVTLA